jgi:hypothetical protein
MLSLQTLTNIEALLLSRSHPLWGELVPLTQIIREVQQAKEMMSAAQSAAQARAQPAVPGPSEPPTPAGYKEVG